MMSMISPPSLHSASSSSSCSAAARPYGLLSFFHAIRLHQWIKNILVFLPLLAAHQWTDARIFAQAFLAFFAFCLVASSVYLLNDVIDLPTDRLQENKRHRPFASGALSVSVAYWAIPLFAISGFVLSSLLSWPVVVSLGVYYGLTLAYSCYLKRVILLDVVLLSLLYGCRVFTGALATQVPISTWLMAFLIFFFLSLALAKRAGELLNSRRQVQRQVPGRGYLLGDLRFIFSIGIVSGYQAVLIFALYINSNAVQNLYRLPQLLWPICVVLLYWISHIWLKVSRGEMRSDPLVLALKDPISYLCAGLGLVAFISAWGVLI